MPLILPSSWTRRLRPLLPTLSKLSRTRTARPPSRGADVCPSFISSSWSPPFLVERNVLLFTLASLIAKTLTRSEDTDHDAISSSHERILPARLPRPDFRPHGHHIPRLERGQSTYQWHARPVLRVGRIGNWSGQYFPIRNAVDVPM